MHATVAEAGAREEFLQFLGAARASAPHRAEIETEVDVTDRLRSAYAAERFDDQEHTSGSNACFTLCNSLRTDASS